jgi:hypothetical protein
LTVLREEASRPTPWSGSGSQRPRRLASLAAAPSILSADVSGWRLARTAEAITLGEVCERAGIEAPDSQDPLTLATLAKQVEGGAPDVVAPEPVGAEQP